ncbi:hypothetical protein MCOR25_008975 [Pyricularia grisea]|uniref:DNA replication regulator Sld3 C-terminal domain-containing protein n=1 Tax=Pyricularia grisea TaxID=148305 RepID=A0A6P8BDQ2_PYRGI|nr:uncharacterized protein PgNI_04809 [Pyricularia grisea]KAI6353488.1 hypothetical protein MCOR25_008975 [Pyricularia grisea]TLD13943.1 hypothetical protein PgNI_04809 [Pyricularia grisea]
MSSSKQPSSDLRPPSQQRRTSLAKGSHPTPTAVTWKASNDSVPFFTAKSTRDPEAARQVDTSTDQGTNATTEATQKAPGLAMEDLLRPSISIKPHPPNLQTKRVQLQPLMLLPRECLSLAYIDLAAPYGELPACRFFESRIRIMELESRLGSSVLVARSESGKHSAYAIERHTNGHYVVCRLGDWVHLDELAQQATVCCRERLGTTGLVSKTPAVVAKPATPTLHVPQLYKASNRKRQAIEDLQSLCRKRPRSPSVAGPSSQEQATACQLPTPIDDGLYETHEHGYAATSQPSEPASKEVSQLANPRPQVSELPVTTDAAQTAEEIFANIRNHYFEALYHSKGNLAYFPKGPLSRARAAFNLNIDGILEMSDLIDFLKSMVLTTVSIDKKYLSTIPNMLDQMKRLVDSSDDGGEKVRKKKSKKFKLGKNGLYSNEDEDVRKWWSATKPELKDDEVSVQPQHMRYHISCLRRRETLLQMILIMEILALEAARPPENPADVQLPGLDTVPTAVVAETGGHKKKRNKHNYPVLLDVHADRLCIWESITLDEVKALAESQTHEDEAEVSDKPLRDFCTDIIVPFFSARLPEVCENLNRKLGGPVKQSPRKQRREKPIPSSSTKVKMGSKPGAVTKRPGTAKSATSKSSARSLERVLSNDKLRRSVSRGPSDALAHLRHATVAHVPGLKREASESRSFSETRSLKDAVDSLEDDPSSATAGSKEKQAPKLMHSRSSSFANADDARAKKKAMVDAELRNAISALKKPNRLLAGKVMVEETEKRLFGGPTYVSNTRKLARSPVNHVQVKATPANARFKDVLDVVDEGALQYGKGFKLARGRSVTQPAAAMASLLEEPAQVGATPRHVANTPSPRQASRQRDAVPNSSPLQARKVAPRPQTEESSQWWQKTKSQPVPFSRDLLQPPGVADLVPASSPHQSMFTAPGVSAEHEDPLVVAIATTPSGKSRTSTVQWQQPRSASLLETPVKKARNNVIAESPSPCQPALLMSGTRAGIKPHQPAHLVFLSPVGRRTSADDSAGLVKEPERPQGGGSTKPKSIYQQLGWDDDLDELL